MFGIKFKRTISGSDLIIWFLISVGVNVVGFFSAVSAKGFSSSEAAAWVQAGGSIVAIWAAVGVAWWQRSAAHDQRLEEEIAESNKTRSLARLSIEKVRDTAQHFSQIAANTFLEEFREGGLERIRDQRKALASLQIAQLSTEQAKAVLEARDICSLALAILHTRNAMPSMDFTRRISGGFAALVPRLEIEIAKFN